MKKTFCLFTSILLYTFTLMSGISEAQLLNGYNQQLYTSVYSSAEGIAMPFLLMQGYKTMPGVTIHNDTMLVFNGQTYAINSKYQNPESGNPNNYYLMPAQYGQYQIQIFKNVWPFHIPNDFYNYSDFSFSSLSDCVGYGTRLLSAVGDTTEAGNAYLKLIKTIKTANTTLIAEKGYVASAYQVGAAFPTLPDVNPAGWEYVSGNINSDSINAYNHRTEPTVLQYNGRIKGGFNLSQQGDILSFSYGPGGESNGHFMVITGTPYLINSDTVSRFYPNVPAPAVQSFLNTYNVYGTPVYDCSGKKAHFHDSRNYLSGIGHGTLWILTQPSTGVPLGFIFEPPATSATTINPILVDNASTWAITVGRYNSKGIGIELNGNEIPDKYKLYQNYPNPFNPATTFKFLIPGQEFVELKIFDLLGSEVKTLLSEKLSSGSYSINWNAEGIASGVYYYKLTAGDFSQTRKLILLK